jgi:hypothetical protein
LLAVGDASVGRALHVEPEKIIVLRYYDTSGGGGELKLIFYTMSAEVIHSRLVATLKTA